MATTIFFPNTLGSSNFFLNTLGSSNFFPTSLGTKILYFKHTWKHTNSITFTLGTQDYFNPHLVKLSIRGNYNILSNTHLISLIVLVPTIILRLSGSKISLDCPFKFLSSGSVMTITKPKAKYNKITCYCWIDVFRFRCYDL